MKKNQINGSATVPPVVSMGKKEMSIGKKIGVIAFAITEAVIVFACGLTWYDWKNDKTLDANALTNIVFYQIIVLMTVWGSKASANFAEFLKLKTGGAK